MQDFDFKQFEPFLFLIIGLVAVIISTIKRNRSISLKDTGERVEGIIYKLEQSGNRNSDLESSSSTMDKITVRFVTKKQEWITSEIKQPFALFFTGQYKPGDKVEVYYDPTDPANFYVDTKQSELVARIVITVVGLIFCLIGLYKLCS
ncbi:DUF3592 domain-containing protein [Panacibacter sp. DH6]|uniref:DUF3592 domain-containing protein n=1 Tax=Panacibacter microcysteis TaxID=2793269 RepID=A0A931GX37_9BACT|nr:DUF3592 domain-containing protein [Panacibacter microcysteis]MBG9377278.1 DUF3592 domain-containing protein [Panacibacter microcysteis]